MCAFVCWLWCLTRLLFRLLYVIVATNLTHRMRPWYFSGSMPPLTTTESALDFDVLLLLPIAFREEKLIRFSRTQTYTALFRYDWEPRKPALKFWVLYAKNFASLHTFLANLHDKMCLSFAFIAFREETFRKVVHQIAQIPAVIFHKLKQFSLWNPKKKYWDYSKKPAPVLGTRFFFLLNYPSIFSINDADGFLAKNSSDRESALQTLRLNLHIICCQSFDNRTR